jgi:hypothetical protein
MALPAEIRRRRLAALAAVAGMSAIAGAAVGSGGGSDEGESASALPAQ